MKTTLIMVMLGIALLFIPLVSFETEDSLRWNLKRYSSKELGVSVLHDDCFKVWEKENRIFSADTCELGAFKSTCFYTVFYEVDDALFLETAEVAQMEIKEAMADTKIMETRSSTTDTESRFVFEYVYTRDGNSLKGIGEGIHFRKSGILILLSFLCLEEEFEHKMPLFNDISKGVELL